MRPVVRVLAALTALVGAILGAKAAAAETRTPLDIVVVAGQSNALGEQSYVVDPTTHENVFTDATRSPADSAVRLMWIETGVHTSGTTPVFLDTRQRLPHAPSPVFGPEVGLARALYADGLHSLLVVKVAFAGTSLANDWKPKHPDLQALIKRVHQAEAWATANGYAPTIFGFYWMQGEADAANASWAKHYGSNLQLFMGNVRKDLDLSSTVPFVLGQIDLTDYINWEHAHNKCLSPSCSAERQWNTEVMDAQAAAAHGDVFLAPTTSLARFHSFMHLTDAAELSLGAEFASLSASALP